MHQTKGQVIYCHFSFVFREFSFEVCKMQLFNQRNNMKLEQLVKEACFVEFSFQKIIDVDAGVSPLLCFLFLHNFSRNSL